MASQLVGLFRTLAWSDFSVVNQQAPPPGQTANAAHTEPTILPTAVQLNSIPGVQPQRFQVADTVTVTIGLDAAKTFRSSWVTSLPPGQQDRLLKHEQGHYDLVALLGRDFFLEVMLLKMKTYATSVDFMVDRNALGARFLNKTQPIQTKYDSATAGGAIQAQQDIWNGFIKTAFTAARTPAATAANGVALKLPILDVLQTAGITI